MPTTPPGPPRPGVPPGTDLTAGSVGRVYRERRASRLAATRWDGSAGRPEAAGAGTAPGAETIAAPGADAGADTIAAPGADTGEDGPFARRVLPDGCMDIIWSSDGALIVAGPDTAAMLARWSPGIRHVGLRFDSGLGPAHLGVPADELRDRRVALADLWGDRAARRLTDRLAEAVDPLATLESAVAARPRHPALVDGLAPVVVEHLRAQVPVREIARAARLSERQLLRRCRPLFGYGPKTLGRILRMQAAVRAVGGGHPIALAAAAAGYADQAHLAREVRALAGVPITRLIGRAGQPTDPPAGSDAEGSAA